MARETTIRTLSANELENVIGGARVPHIRLTPPVDGGGDDESGLVFESREAKG
jgi:bacteriocin-like protein